MAPELFRCKIVPLIYVRDFTIYTQTQERLHANCKSWLFSTSVITLARRRQLIQRAAVRVCERRGLQHVLQCAPGAGKHRVLVDAVHEHDEQQRYVSGRQRRPRGLRVRRHYVPCGHRVVGLQVCDGPPGGQHVCERLHRRHQCGHLQRYS